MSQKFLPVTNSNSSFLATDYFTPGPAVDVDQIRNDKDVGFSIQPVVQDLQNASVPFAPDFETGDTYAMAIGNPDEPPTSGSVALIVGATATGLGAISPTITAAALQTALNAALTTEGKPLCTVVLLASGNYQIIGATNGVVASGFFAVTNDALLYPISDAFFVEGNLGSGSSPYQLLLVMRQAPMCYAEPSTPLTAVDVVLTEVQAGDATHNHIQQISFNVEQVSGGGYTINATANAVTTTCGTGTPLMDARALGLVLAQHPEINYQTTNEDDNIAVKQVGQTWVVEFIGDLGNDAANLITVTNNDLIGPEGLSGTINYNTFGLYVYSLGQDGDTFTLTRSIQRTRATGEIRTLYSGPVTIYKDLIDASTAIPTPLPSYYTSAQVDTLLALKQDLDSTLTTLSGKSLTGTGDIVLKTSPTLVTPTLGVATATSLAVGDVTSTGDLIVNTAGKGLEIKSGTGERAGNATLVAGTVTVTNTTVTANTLILLDRKTAGGTLGAGGYVYTLSAGASFTITSVDTAGSISTGDTSVISYMLIEIN